MAKSKLRQAKRVSANQRNVVKKLAAATARQLAKAKGQEAAALTKLKPISKEINIRLTKAEKMASDAFDHRLAAAIRLEDARKMCKKSGVHFKKWVEANVTHAYETVRKLVVVGAAPDPALALADLRLGGAKRAAKSKAKAISAGGVSNTKGDTPPPASAASRTAWEVAEDTDGQLDFSQDHSTDYSFHNWF